MLSSTTKNGSRIEHREDGKKRAKEDKTKLFASQVVSCRKIFIARNVSLSKTRHRTKQLPRSNNTDRIPHTEIRSVISSLKRCKGTVFLMYTVPFYCTQSYKIVYRQIRLCYGTFMMILRSEFLHAVLRSVYESVLFDLGIFTFPLLCRS